MSTDWAAQRAEAQRWYEEQAIQLHYRLLDDWDMKRHQRAVAELRLALAERLAAIARAEKGHQETT